MTPGGEAEQLPQEPSAARRPGRPPQTDEEARRARAHILAATTEVFGEHGYHGVSVARIIEVAQIARPTFYRYFRNTDEALNKVLSRLGYSIATAVGDAVAAEQGHIPRLVAGIEAYLQWTFRNRSLLRSIYAGGHDPTSPIFLLRPRLLRQLNEMINLGLAEQGRPPVTAWTIDLFINSMEYACFKLNLETDLSPEAVNSARAALLRTALSLLGTEDDWRLVLDTPFIKKQLFLS